MDAALVLACQKRELKKIEALLEKGEINLDFQDTLGNTALHYLCMSDDACFAEQLIDAGAEPGIENNQLVTPLHLAVIHGTIPLVKLLLEKGADINAQDLDDKTPLIFAIGAGKEEIAEYLISAGADKNTRTINYLTPLDFAKAANMDALFPFFDSRFPWIDRKGNSYLHNAVYQNGISVIRNILNTDTSGIDARNNEGLTPLLVSVSRLNHNITEMLLRFGANPGLARPKDGYTPLHIAAENGVTILGEILLEHGAKINAQNSDGVTPLMLAIQGQQRDFISLLVRRGAAGNIVDNKGKSARDYAMDWGATDLAKMFEALNLQRYGKIQRKIAEPVDKND